MTTTNQWLGAVATVDEEGRLSQSRPPPGWRTPAGRQSPGIIVPPASGGQTSPTSGPAPPTAAPAVWRPGDDAGPMQVATWAQRMKSAGFGDDQIAQVLTSWRGGTWPFGVSPATYPGIPAGQVGSRTHPLVPAGARVDPRDPSKPPLASSLDPGSIVKAVKGLPRWTLWAALAALLVLKGR